MARGVIGLDVGTNAVTVAEVVPGTPPRLVAFGQVALARDVMREGEIVDPEGVTSAIARLRTELGLRRARVRVGLASPRLIVRQVEMPVMTREELAGALRFQAQELIPIPLDEAVIDFAILGTVENDAGESVMQVLLAAAHSATVTRLVDAVEGAGLGVESVDLVPLALIRALGHAVSDNGSGAEGIVSFGGGVTCVVVHENGIPRFVRVLGSGGRELTDAVSAGLELPFETAESVKRQVGNVSDDVVARARLALERPLAAVLDEVRSSLDYYRNQPGAARLLRVVTTGGGALLPGLVDRLSTLVGLPVQMAEPRAQLTVGDIGFDEAELPRLDPYLPVAVGLALPAGPTGAAIDLLPHGTRGTNARTRAVAMTAAGLAGLVVLLAIPTIARQHSISHEHHLLAEQQAHNLELQTKIGQLADAQAKQSQLDALQAQITGLLSTDVSWSRMLQDIARTIPNDVWLTSFQGTVTPATAVTPSTPPATASSTTTGSGRPVTTPTTAPAVTASDLSGTVNFSAVGTDYPAVAAWLKMISELPSLSDLWVPNISEAKLGDQNVVNFSSTANLTPSARSNRLEHYTEDTKR
ncbi:MAG TPA: type IV pilus assembly protein PilM [Acidimicrobiia bacterium]|nr:type IV pilus assembly protein PilM [Acidimicrobiia bacterium]